MTKITVSPSPNKDVNDSINSLVEKINNDKTSNLQSSDFSEVEILKSVITSKRKHDKFLAWQREQNLLAIEKQKKTVDMDDVDFYKMCWDQGVPYSGAIGGSLTYQVTPTSFGHVIKVIHNHTKAELNITEFDWW